MYVMSVPQAVFGTAAVKLRLSRLGATGSACAESVVGTNFFAYLQRNHNTRMCLTTRA